MTKERWAWCGVALLCVLCSMIWIDALKDPVDAHSRGDEQHAWRLGTPPFLVVKEAYRISTTDPLQNWGDPGAMNVAGWDADGNLLWSTGGVHEITSMPAPAN